MREQDLEEVLLPARTQPVETFWATIESTDPIRIRKDTGDIPNATPGTTVPLEQGARAWCLLDGNRLTILGTDPPISDATLPPGGDVSDFLTKTGTADGETGWFTRLSLFNLIYPIGSIYLSMNTVNPGTLFGGTWNKLPAGFYLLSADSGAGATAGSSTSGSTALTTNQIPAHTHTRGTMNITGTGVFRDINNGDNNSILSANGAFSVTRTRWSGSHDAFDKASKSSFYYNNLVLDAQDSWTGATSSVGGDQGHTHTINPPNIKIIAWQRTA